MYFVWLASRFPLKEYLSREEDSDPLERLLALKVALKSDDAIISNEKGKQGNYVSARYYAHLRHLVM